ncbi:MAG TPA: hypothetical protein VFK14_08845 [Solirubrobacterales bacterium]|nr:hypothetical protein [Solirubrobacterales bacterium]
MLVAGVLVAGCGESRHANEPRPQVSRRVSVTINPGQVIVQPAEIGAGPERNQQIPQNQHSSQPPIKTNKPLDVIFVIVNQTGRDSTVQVRRQSQLLEGIKVPARSPESIQLELPTGAYSVGARAGGTDIGKAPLTIGSYRASSKNDVLLP